MCSVYVASSQSCHWILHLPLESSLAKTNDHRPEALLSPRTRYFHKIQDIQVNRCQCWDFHQSNFGTFWWRLSENGVTPQEAHVHKKINLSTIINHHQPLSTIINHSQPLSTIINHYQPLHVSTSGFRATSCSPTEAAWLEKHLRASRGRIPDCKARQSHSCARHQGDLLWIKVNAI